jgi:hypothetical protein
MIRHVHADDVEMTWQEHADDLGMIWGMNMLMM